MTEQPLTPSNEQTGPPPLAGIVLVDKPADRRITSMTVVRSVRRRLIAGGVAAFGPRGGTSRNIKVGHAGTLDPLASGLLVVLVGKATRLCEPLMARTKVYAATIDLSRRSPTDDLEAPTIPNDIAAAPVRADVDRALPAFVGEISQTPPAHSAIWVEGERAYELARKGDAPVLKARTIRIDDIRVASYEFPLLTLEIRCGKGTYIRSLARDIGLALTGRPAVLTALRRTFSAPFSVEQATPLNDLPTAMTRADLLPVNLAGDQP